MDNRSPHDAPRNKGALLISAAAASAPSPSVALAGPTDRGSSTRLTMSVPEFCEMVGISKSTFYLEVREGRIQLLKAGAKTLVARTEPAKYLAEMAAAAASRSPRRRKSAA